VKLQIRTTFDFGKLANKAQNIVDKFVTNAISGESKQMKNRISSGSTLTGKMKALTKSAKETRKLRGISGTTPLNATGALLNSIKPTPKGISAKEYGSWHNIGFVTKNRPIIPDKGGVRFNFAGKTIPARRWMHDSETFKNDKKIVDKFFKDIGKALKK